MPQSGNRTTVGVLRLGLAVIFLVKALPLVLGATEQIAAFDRYRYPQWFRVAIGCLQGISALLLLTPRTAAWGLSVLAGILVGAVFTMVNADELRQALVPLVGLGLLGYIAWYSRDL